MKWLEDSIIFESIAGSHIYGTNTPSSDFDYRGVCIPPLEILLGLDHFEQKDKWDNINDRVIYSLKKFFLLCKDNNPNIIELLFIPEKFWVKSSPIWLEIIQFKDFFMSKKIKYTFSGYAHSQIERIKRHRSWLLDPPKEEPTREKYGLPNRSKLNFEQRSAILSLPLFSVVEEFKEEAMREKAYRQAKNYWDSYQQWKRNRNRERAKLEEKFRYDTKHASHLFRLIYEAEEALTKGFITFPRPEADEILAIKNGKYSYSELLEKVGKWEDKFEDLYEKSFLPISPDMKNIMKLYKSIVWKYFSLEV